MNDDTEIFPIISESMRQVKLIRGEAHFQVVKDPGRPFIVSAKGVAVRAVGTAFNVRLGANQMDVLVTEGSVEIGADRYFSDSFAKEPHAQGDASTERNPISLKKVLTSGQKADVYFDASDLASLVEVKETSREEIDRQLRWKDSLLTFGGTSLLNIAESFEKKTGFRLIIADEELKGLKIGGSFPSNDPIGFLKLMESNYGIPWQQHGDIILVGEQ